MRKHLDTGVFRLSCLAALLLAFANFAIAQAPPRPGAPSPPPGPPPNNPLGSPPPASGDLVTLQYPNSDVADLLHLYEQLTNKKLIFDNTVQGKVNLFISKPLPRDEAVRVMEMSLLLNGYSLVPAEGDLMKVIGAGKNPRSAGVPIISDEADIPESDRVISFVFKLRYADPTELQQVLTGYLQPASIYTSFLALPKAGAIVVTENSSVIRSLVRIIDQIDVAPAEVKSEFIKLERADASKVVDMLNAVFEKGNQPAGTVPGRNVRPITPPGAPVPAPPPQVQAENDIGAIAALSEESVIVGKIKLAADVRTNRIHVITRPINMPFIRKLIAEFDANVEFAKPVVRPLQFISASDVLAVIVQTLTEPGATGQGGAEGGANPNLNPQQQQQQRRNNSTVTSPYTGGQTATATDSNLNVSEELSTTPTDTTPKAVTVGNAKIIADARANSIIILGNREIVVKVQKLLDEMDVRAPQVALSTVIGELTLSNTEDFGIDYLLKFQRQNGPGSSTGYAGTSLNGNNAPLFDPSKLYNFTQINKAAAATGGILGTNVYVAAGDALTALVHALNTTGRFKTISRPTVFTTNNKKAIIASGQEVPVPVNTITNATGGGIINTGLAQQSNIEFKKVALQLEVVPLINSEKEVSLDILQKIDSLGTPATIDGNLIPTINTRYIRTNVSAPNCSTIILGGLIQEPHTRNTSGIPVLSKIPVVGALFRRTTTDKSRQELIILMRPEVTLTKLDVVRLRAKHEDRTHFGGELEQDDCPDCPPKVDRDDKQLPAPDLPIDK